MKLRKCVCFDLITGNFWRLLFPLVISEPNFLFILQEYDFVFSVDIAEGEPPLKLPYNMTEDPWVAAQNFITKHGLNQAFLEQVRDFIVQNTQSVSMSQQSTDSNYRDPFTGKIILLLSLL